MPRAQRLEFLEEELRRATELVAFSEELAASGKRLAEQLMRGSGVTSLESRRARALIDEAERERGTSGGAASEGSIDPDEAARQRSILLARQLLAGARVARRDSRRYRWRVARRLAELEGRG
jgi:hypothetical protein